MLKLQSIHKTYNPGSINETVLFTDFNLNVREGDFISIIGSNGSGKSSLLNIISGGIPIDGGMILLRDKDISKMKEHNRSRYMGRVFQNPALGTCPSMTIMENMALAENKGKPFHLVWGVKKEKADGYRQMLARLNLGLEDKLHVPVGALSGGQRQALALLMSAMYRPDLLLLDEHTAALDPKTSEVIMELTDEIVREQKVTTIMVTHNLRFAVEYGNRLIMMHQGKIILDISGKEKQEKKIDDLLGIFNEISIECGN